MARSKKFVCGDGRSDADFIKDLWKQFTELFPTDEVCMLEILRRMGISTTHCKLCGSTHVELEKESRVMVCHQCGKRMWLTAGTFFGYIKKPRAWLGAIWLIEHGGITNACAFQKLASIAYSSSIGIFHKVSTAVAKNMSDEFPTITWSEFCEVYARRSRETPKRYHPAADERTDSDEVPDSEDPLADSSPSECHQSRSVSTATSQAPDCNDVQKSILENLTQIPISVERLCEETGASAGEVISNLTLLELMNLVRPVGVDAFVANKVMAPSSSSSHRQGESFDDSLRHAVVFFRAFIEAVFDRISQKYLRQYLASFWCLIDRARWRVDAVFDACKQFGPLPYKKLVHSHSPRAVFFPTPS